MNTTQARYGLLFLVFGVFLLCGYSRLVAAAQEQVQQVRIYSEEQALYLDADVQFQLSNELREAANKGVPLYFTADVEIYQHRWWWFDKSILVNKRTWKLIYSPLTRQWRIGSGDLLRPAESLSDALLSLQHIRQWRIGETKEFQTGVTYNGRFRLRLDSSLLARPFQVDVLNRSNWSLATPWHDFQFTISDEKHP